MTGPVPRGHYLYVHDAVRRVFGRDNVELSAFVRNKHPFQCDMLINAAETDPDVLQGNVEKVKALLKRLQPELGSCALRAHEQRVDIVFRDQHVLQLALGAPKAWLGDLQETKDINREPDWQKRNRLRISLGFDEKMFTASCGLGINLAARALEKYTYNYYKHSPVLSLLPGNLKEAFDRDYRGVIPPVTYWQAHCYAFSQAYPVRHHMELEATVWRNFAQCFGRFPFDNPYCAGEDLNTMTCAKLLCSIWQPLPFASADDVRETTMTVGGADSEGEVDGGDGQRGPEGGNEREEGGGEKGAPLPNRRTGRRWWRWRQ